jgi:hypothetical protein
MDLTRALTVITLSPTVIALHSYTRRHITSSSCNTVGLGPRDPPSTLIQKGLTLSPTVSTLHSYTSSDRLLALSTRPPPHHGEREQTLLRALHPRVWARATLAVAGRRPAPAPRDYRTAAALRGGDRAGDQRLRCGALVLQSVRLTAGGTGCGDTDLRGAGASAGGGRAGVGRRLCAGVGGGDA